MTHIETSSEIEMDAADWMARLDRGLSVEETAAFEAWVAEDVRRYGAVMRMQAVFEHFDRERLNAATPRPSRPPWLGRREFITGGAIAAGLAVTALVAPRLFGAGQTYATAKGQLRSVTLADGSVILLNTASKVRVHYTAGQRSIALLQGEALFDVAKDPSRPFVVQSQALDVRAVGTSFSVSRLPGKPLEVMVRAGLVDVSGTAPQAPPPTRLIPGCRAIASDLGSVAVRHVGVPAVQRALAWRDGRLDFDGVSLAEAAQVFARYSDDHLTCDSPEISRTPVSGLFNATDPETFARAIALAHGFTVRRDGQTLHISH